MVLTVDDIQEINEEKEKIKFETFDRIVRDIDSKIYKKVYLNENQIFIRVPPFVVGEPLYDWKELIKYTYSSLKSRGFKLKYIADGQIYVTWNIKKNKDSKKQISFSSSLEELASKY